MKAELVFGVFLLLLTSCSSSERNIRVEKEKMMIPEVRTQLQGVWFDQNTESPVLEFKGDSLLYASKSDSPMKYKLIDDTLFVCGLYTTAYPVLHRTESSLIIQNPMGDQVSLYKSTQESVTISDQSPDVEQVREVIKKDTVILHKKNRYRGYTTINPTSIKVICPGLTEDGFTVDNVYYDNIIHICVYEGKERLCGKDIKKEFFKDVVPEDFLNRSILYDVDFVGVEDDNFKFYATLVVPDGPCYNAYVLIDRKNELVFRQVK